MKSKELILGTALWGWKIPEVECFTLLDEFYKSGCRDIDTATNYPINGVSNLFRFAENTIFKWINSNGVNDLKIFVKIGSLNNSGRDENLLTYTSLLLSHEYYNTKFGKNLDGVMIHWDNRENPKEIANTIEALKLISASHRIGISGIKNPKLYIPLTKNGLIISIQCKHNFLTSQLNLYSDFYSHRISIYGINGGGINLKREYKKNSSVILREINVNNFTPKIELINQLLIKYKKNGGDTSLYNIALTFAFINEHVDGLVIAPSNLSQLKATIFSFNELVQGINLPYYKKIIGIINSYE